MKKLLNGIWLIAAATLLGAASGKVMAGGLIPTIGVFDWSNFTVDDGPLVIDNHYWPLLEGTTFTYEAQTEDECELNIVTVLPLASKKTWGDVDNDAYDFIEAVQVSDTEWVDETCTESWGDPVEITTDWYAQDKDDNIWYLGEATIAFDHDDECDNWVNPANYDEGCRDGSWQAGVDGAEAGIVMLGNPKNGNFYFQEYWEDEAEDMGKVLRLNARVSTEDFGDFDDCLKTKEWNRLEPGEIEHKYYCFPEGLVLIEELKGKTKWVELIDP